MTVAFKDDYVPQEEHLTPMELVLQQQLDPGDRWYEYPSPSRPYDVAERATEEMFTTADSKLRTLIYWNGDFWAYTGTHFELMGDELEVKKPLWKRLNSVHYLGKDKEELPWSPTSAKINGLMEPVKILLYVDAKQPAPSWLPPAEGEGLDASRIISTKNGLLDLETRELIPHSPGLLTTWSLPFDYDPNATCPLWLQFLEQIFTHDPNAALALQEFVGYIISGRIDLQQALMIIGPPRAGKGTTSRIVQKLIGNGNTVPTSLDSLGSEFGMEALIGKPLAVIEDARSNKNIGSTVERLLNITGQDDVAVNRKGIKIWYGKLPTRFMVFSNEMPRFFDSSGAITSRFTFIRLKENFVGKEDKDLEKKLSTELSGIFNWALQGLDRLNKNNGKFTRPDTMDEMQDLMNDMASPLKRFFEEEYEITGDESDILDVSTVLDKFKWWWEDQGKEPINRETFIQRATATLPSLRYKNTTLDGKKRRRFYGIKKPAPYFSALQAAEPA